MTYVATHVDPALQIEHDGLRLGVCLAIAKRLEQFPDFKMPGLRTGLTPRQLAAVEAYNAAVLR